MKQRGGFRLSTIWGNHELLLLPLGILSAMLLIAVWVAAYNYGSFKEPFLRGQTTVLSEGWSDDAGNSVSLPLKQTYQQGGYEISLTLTSVEQSRQSLLFWAKYLNVRIFLDNEEIGSCLCRPVGEDRTLGKAFVLLPLPENMSGRTLRIEAEPLLGAEKQYEIIAPRMGSDGQLIYEIICNELPLLLVIAAIFCFGIFLLLFGVQTMCISGISSGAYSYQANFLQNGMFAILFSFYSLTITDSIYLFVQNFYFIYLMEFLLLALLPLPLLAQTAAACKPQYAKLLLADSCFVCLNACVQAYLHFFAGGVELRDMVSFTHGLLVASVVLLIFALMFGSKQKKKRWWLPLSLAPMLVGALMDIFRYYLPGTKQKAVDFQLGVLLFLLMQTAYLIRINLTYYENHLKFSVYRKMAYTDALTGLANRAAFEEKLAGIRGKQEHYSSIWCLCADVNNLKQANDTFGHAMGDQLIKAAACGLQTAAPGIAEIYRTGGDEFVVFLFNRSEAEIAKLKERLDAAIEEYNRVHELELSVALGCDRYRFTAGDTIDKLLSRTDELMYEDKRNWKERG